MSEDFKPGDIVWLHNSFCLPIVESLKDPWGRNGYLLPISKHIFNQSDLTLVCRAENREDLKDK